MIDYSSRRLFMRNTAIMATGISLFSSNCIAQVFSNENCPFDGYNPFSEEKNDLRKAPFIKKQVTVKGKIYDKTGLVPVPNATIEVWHLSPNSMKFKHRAQFLTNESGEYHFITDYPNREVGKLPRIYFKVSKGDKTYFSELLFNDFGACISGEHWENNKQLGDRLFPQKKSLFGSPVITFNISI